MRYLVTGGTGFLGSSLVRRLAADGHFVRVLDDDSRGARSRLADCSNKIELVIGDIRKPQDVSRAVEGVDCVCHLAYVNGTEYFYSKPELVLEVGVKGMMNVLDACIEHGVKELSLASTSEVYQTAPLVPTPETVPLVVPDPLNPRYSYGGGKIISELLAINYGRRHFNRVTLFRPHNVYGPDMGFEHVIPQFAVRLQSQMTQPSGRVPFTIQGSGQETRSFIFIDDAVDGIVRVLQQGEHLGIYNVGTDVEVAIEQLARAVARCAGREIDIVHGPLQKGSTMRRCPDISKLRSLGFAPTCTLEQGLSKTVPWYLDHAVSRHSKL